MDIVYIIILCVSVHIANSQNTINARGSNTIENRLVALEEQNRRLEQKVQGKLK